MVALFPTLTGGLPPNPREAERPMSMPVESGVLRLHRTIFNIECRAAKSERRRCPRSACDILRSIFLLPPCRQPLHNGRNDWERSSGAARDHSQVRGPRSFRPPLDIELDGMPFRQHVEPVPLDG